MSLLRRCSQSVAALSLASVLATTGGALAAGRVALVVGNASYEKLAPLNNPVNDAARMAELLAANGFAVMSCDGQRPGCFDLDREDMTDALESFEKMARGAEVAVVFYAGHGMQTAKGNVLAPVNMELSCDTLDPTKATMLDNVMEALADAQDKIIIIDACRNDPFQAQACAQRGARPLSFGSIAVPDTDSRFLIMSSTKPGQYAADGPAGTHSPFAESLFHWMEKEPSTNFDQLFDRVTKHVIEKTTALKFTQIPEVLIRGGSPETCLSGSGCTADPEAAALRNEVETLRAEKERSQEYEEIVVTLLKSAGYSSLDAIPSDQRESFFGGIMDATKALADRGDSAGERALAALKQGDERAAETLFEEELASRRASAAQDMKLAAESARHIASLARPKDVAKAARFYGEAASLDPEDIETWMNFAWTSRDAGNTADALRAFREASARARDFGTDAQRLWAAFGQGDIVMAHGRLERALDFYVAARNIAQKQSDANPENNEFRRDLSVAHNRVGSVQFSQGHFAQAIESYLSGLRIMEELVAIDPSYGFWKSDLSFGHNKLGEVYVAQGYLDKALDAYGEALRIRQELAQAEPENQDARRDVQFSELNIGDVLFAQQKLDEAMAHYQTGMEIARALADADPGNAGRQRELSVAYNKIGDIEYERGDYAAAWETYDLGKAAIQAVADLDPENSGFQRDLYVSYNKVGAAQQAMKNFDGALASFEAALAISERLAGSDRTNQSWQQDVSIAHERIGDLHADKGDTEAAYAAYLRKHQIVMELAQVHADNVAWQWDLYVSYWRMANYSGDPVTNWELALGVLERLQAEGRLAPNRVQWVDVTKEKLEAARASAAAPQQ